MTTTPKAGTNNVPVGPASTDEPAAGTEPIRNASALPPHRASSVLEKIRKLERRAVHLPVVGKLHAPDFHDVVYVGGIAALLTLGAVELPIALTVLGGHLLVKQHQSRSLSAIGEVMEDVWGHG